MAAPDLEESAISPLLVPTQEELASINVFRLITDLKRDVTKTVGKPVVVCRTTHLREHYARLPPLQTQASAYSLEQLKASDNDSAFVQPLVNKYTDPPEMAIVYACLVVRSYFLAEADLNLASTAVMQSRATFCELLAIKLVNPFASNNMQLLTVLASAWSPLAGANLATVEKVRSAISNHDLETSHTALEMAVCTSSKAFLAEPVIQKVINDIYSGNVVFSLLSTRSILADNYKPRAIQIYDVRKAPFLNHYRLRVPRYGAIFKYLNFAILLVTFILCVADHNRAHPDFWELTFTVIALAHVLEGYTALTEHGWQVYIANMWKVFDFSFIVIFLAYFVLRIKGLYDNDLAVSRLAFDILACGSCILLPRLVFFAMANYVIILSLQAMIVQLVVFICTVVICFSGLMFTLWILARDTTISHKYEPWTFSSLAWYCMQIWLGNSYTVVSEADSFHPIIGPILVTVFALFSNQLLVTVLISILSNTVTRIDSNATQEYLFQFAISTIEGVKNEALFSYQPPFNILAFVILKPASWFLSPRTLHTVNVFLIRLTSLPQLIVIAIYERHLRSGSGHHQSRRDTATSIFQNLPRRVSNMSMFVALLNPSRHSIYDAILHMEADEESDRIYDSDSDESRLFNSQETQSRRNSLASDVAQVQTRINGLETSPSRATGSMRRRVHAASTARATLRFPTPRQRIRPAHVLGIWPRNRRLTAGGYGTTESTLVEAGRAFPAHTINSSSRGSENSELTRLYGSRISFAPTGKEQILNSASVGASTSVEVQEILINKFGEEIKEIQEYQKRIESLLSVLTRGMRNNDLHPNPN